MAAGRAEAERAPRAAEPGPGLAEPEPQTIEAGPRPSEAGPRTIEPAAGPIEPVPFPVGPGRRAIEPEILLADDPGLARLVAAWPGLPAMVRAGILALIEATLATGQALSPELDDR